MTIIPTIAPPPPAFYQLRFYFALASYAWGSFAIHLASELGMGTFPIFTALFFLTVMVVPPKLAFSPLTALYGYYGAWFILAPAFAGKYEGVLNDAAYTQSFAYAYSVFGACVLGLLSGERWADKNKTPIRRSFGGPRDFTLTLIVIALYVASTIFVALIVQFSGGLGHWLENPGQAFLHRGGTGLFVIGSHFCSLALGAASGYKAVRARRAWPILLFFAWVLATAFVHGSKLQIGTLLLVAIVPYLSFARFFSLTSLMLGASAVIVFLGGMFLRHQQILSSWGLILSTLNYFSALENLAISLRDFQPGILNTFFLPFNKIGMIFGIVDQNAYFDMNHMLTDIYYPKAWAIRATEQWPVETDLYLNFHFFFGLPLIFCFFFTHGWLFGYARRVNSVGAWFAVVMLSVGIISHLRGSLYNHVDFYLYPYIFAIFLMMNGWRWERGEAIKFGIKFTLPRAIRFHARAPNQQET